MLESDGPGGAENMLLQLAEELHRRGYGICPVLPDKGLGWLAEGMHETRGFSRRRSRCAARSTGAACTG